MRASVTYPLAALVSMTTVASACEPPVYDPLWRDKPIRVAKDCSFDQAEAFDGASISASHAQKVGPGTLGQVVTEYVACGTYQTLLFVDCDSAEAVLVDAPEGNPPISFGGENNREIKDLYPPRGKLQLRTNGDVAQVAGQAKRHGYRHTTNVMAVINKMKKRNRYDPFCGCALYYPDSAGAAKATRRR